tara:strand:- start:1890 stop:3086 length:1197 start_codon:yes stop_codon:yes gene_type:complete
MSCPAILTGQEFVTRVLEHVDCQARLLGSYGYLALGEPGSVASLLVTGLLTIFVALFGIRLIFGPPPGARDVVSDVLNIGIVLSLAFSWPAFRTVIHDVVLDGPAEVAATLGSGAAASPGRGLVDRLQAADNAIVSLTEIGSGRDLGARIDESVGSSSAGSAIGDADGFGSARIVFLGGIIGSMALLRILAGILLALAPLAAGLLLFEATRGLFAGWLRGLVLTLIGSIGVGVAVAIELAILEPWLADALRVRSLGYATPSAPTELLAMTVAFTLVQLGMVWAMGRIAWHRGWLSMPAMGTPNFPARSDGAPAAVRTSVPPEISGRAERLSWSVENIVRHDSAGVGVGTASRTGTVRDDRPGSSVVPTIVPVQERLGGAYRRTATPRVRAGDRMDLRQ